MTRDVIVGAPGDDLAAVGPHDDPAAHPPSARGRGRQAHRHGVDRRRREGAARSLPGRGRHAADHRHGARRTDDRISARPPRPLRVAIVGAGPAGFYVAEHLLRRPDLVVDVDMFDRLPTPFGLVRAGVAPDHQKIKAVTAAFDKIAGHAALPLLRRRRARQARGRRRPARATTTRSSTRPARRPTGAWASPARTCRAATPRPSSSPGTTAIPTIGICQFDLSQERVAVVGVGNVAIDVARILSRTPEELEKTDIAEHALEALRASRVREVYLLGRRGAGPGGLHESGDQGAGRAGRRRRRGQARGGRARRAEPGRRSSKSGDRADLEEGRDPPGLRARGRAGQAATARDPLPRLAGGPARQRPARSAASGSCAIGCVASDTGTIAGRRPPISSRSCRSGSSSARSATAACRCRACPSTRSGASC